MPANPAGTSTRGSGAKRGRKPKNATLTTESTRTSPQTSPTTSLPTPLQWTAVQSNAPGPSTVPYADGATSPGGTDQNFSSETGGVLTLAGVAGPVAALAGDPSSSRRASVAPGAPAAEEDGEVEDEFLPAMADDDYSAQLSWQSQSKDNLKVLMDNFSPAQYDRFEAYRRNALPKQAIRKVVQQTLGQQVSLPVAQVVAGFGKVFVGEMVEKARAVQTRRGETGPLSPDHLREAYRLYQKETGRVGAARPLRSKRVFVK